MTFEVGDYVIPDEAGYEAWPPCKVLNMYKNGDLRARSIDGRTEIRGPWILYKKVDRPLQFGDLVRIAPSGRKVWVIRSVSRKTVRDFTGGLVNGKPVERSVKVYSLDTGADHPDAAKRIHDAYEWYTADRLVLVRPVS
jgi:hypothetical protein